MTRRPPSLALRTAFGVLGASLWLSQLLFLSLSVHVSKTSWQQLDAHTWVAGLVAGFVPGFLVGVSIPRATSPAVRPGIAATPAGVIALLASLPNAALTLLLLEHPDVVKESAAAGVDALVPVLVAMVVACGIGCALAVLWKRSRSPRPLPPTRKRSLAALAVAFVCGLVSNALFIAQVTLLGLDFLPSAMITWISVVVVLTGTPIGLSLWIGGLIPSARAHDRRQRRNLVWQYVGGVVLGMAAGQLVSLINPAQSELSLGLGRAAALFAVIPYSLLAWLTFAITIPIRDKSLQDRSGEPPNPGAAPPPPPSVGHGYPAQPGPRFGPGRPGFLEQPGPPRETDSPRA